MRADFYGLTFETPRLTIHLWTPWRAAAVEHRLFEAVSNAIGIQPEQTNEGLVLTITDAKPWRAALQAVARVLKGWQEEADPGRERRRWRWLLEGDTDPYGYDMHGEPASVWALIRVSLEHGGPAEGEKGEDIDLEGFSVRIWRTQ